MAIVKRAFVITGHKAALTPQFNLNDLPGSAGRMDILARCVTAAFCLSHAIRTDVEVDLVLRDQVTIRFVGDRLKRLNSDERSTAALIRHALRARLEGHRESTPGVFVMDQGLQRTTEELRDQGLSLYVLDERGQDLWSCELAEPVALVLSDHQNFTPHEQSILQGEPMIGLGPRLLQADHCIPIVHHELDLREEQLL